MKASLADFKLCYVDPRSSFAWFTSAPLHLQWGDDWNDAPYEHNAGEPYGDHKVDGRRVPHQLLKVAWEGPFETPRDRHVNSPWSVEDINRGGVAWLVPERWSSHTEAVPAGTSLTRFIDILTVAGGTVYVPLDVAEAVQKSLDKSVT